MEQLRSTSDHQISKPRDLCKIPPDAHEYYYGLMANEKVTEVPDLVVDSHANKFYPTRQLGAGGFATCWLATTDGPASSPQCDAAKDPAAKVRRRPERYDRIASPCALKAVKSSVPRNLAQRFRLELAIQSKLFHEGIVRMHRAFTFEKVTYVVLELCDNGSLTDMMRKRRFLTMGEIRRILLQLCAAVKYLHDRDIVHRDIKAGNIFLDSKMNAKLGDFGLAAIMEPSADGDPEKAKKLQHIRRTTFCGTPNYLAPEILSRHEGHGMSVDIWAIGILAYYLAVGRAPFHSKSKDEIYGKLRKGEYSWPALAPDQNEIPQDLKDLVATILVEETQRPSLQEIAAHPFFSHGFIPASLDPLCKTRRPKWARTEPDASASPSSSQPSPTYQKLFEAVQRKTKGSMYQILARELNTAPCLSIPLCEGYVYTARLEMPLEGKIEDGPVDMAKISAAAGASSLARKKTDPSSPRPAMQKPSQTRTQTETKSKPETTLPPPARLRGAVQAEIDSKPESTPAPTTVRQRASVQAETESKADDMPPPASRPKRQARAPPIAIKEDEPPQASVPRSRPVPAKAASHETAPSTAQPQKPAPTASITEPATVPASTTTTRSKDVLSSEGARRLRRRPPLASTAQPATTSTLPLRTAQRANRVRKQVEELEQRKPAVAGV